MNRRYIYYLAGATVLFGVAGALVNPVPHILTLGQPIDEVEFDLAPKPSGDVAWGLEIISGNDRVEVSAVPASDAVAGVKTKGTGLELSG